MAENKVTQDFRELLNEKFSVVQFFMDDSYEYVRKWVDPVEAIHAAHFYSTNVAARIGTTKRVIIVDTGDSICWEWEYGKGVVFPILAPSTNTVN